MRIMVLVDLRMDVERLSRTPTLVAKFPVIVVRGLDNFFPQQLYYELVFILIVMVLQN